ncbi:MAG: Coenzyme F420 hydrogenase/dehydrogenase, beta subunit C-terminal domain [Bacteroidaceae bacterium]|nr:Coenzyme F420 hydrogenase/dehydrogenase, beta subunit C-terminal domain [Bacteroidaceae bacterium]
MIIITDKHNCCGCNACGDICPKQAISFKNDNEGFWYPEVDMQKCIDCGLCEKICPCLNVKEAKQPISAFAAVNPDDELRMKSSSGGVFWLLVEQTIREGGVVFGAAFDNEWMVYHSSSESLEEAERFRRSKYVQSLVKGCYKQAQGALKQGRKVLFSGTACQIAALKEFLRKDYDNLLTVDVVCHGVPSPAIWKEYIKTLASSKTIKNINFRDKCTGWRNYDFSVQFSDGTELKEPHNKNLYMQGFLHDLYLRPSCHSCKFKAGKCGSDLTLGDFWGIEKVVPEIDDDHGVSLVIINSLKGKDSIDALPLSLKVVDSIIALKENPCISIATPEKKWRSEFMEQYVDNGGINAISLIVKKMQPSFVKRLLLRVRRLFR